MIVATGEFQRVLPCIAACQAGKDVYAEKPLSWSIGEGRALVEAVKRHGRILQMGTQQRSMAVNRLAREFVRSGGLGKLLEVRKLEINRNKIASNPPEIAAGIMSGLDAAEEDRKWSDDAALWQARWHLQNWLDCIRDRRPPVSTAEAGHRSISVCHLANIARRLGRDLTWDPAAERFTDDEANGLVAPPRRRGFELPA